MKSSSSPERNVGFERKKEDTSSETTGTSRGKVRKRLLQHRVESKMLQELDASLETTSTTSITAHCNQKNDHRRQSMESMVSTSRCHVLHTIRAVKQHHAMNKPSVGSDDLLTTSSNFMESGFFF